MVPNLFLDNKLKENIFEENVLRKNVFVNIFYGFRIIPSKTRLQEKIKKKHFGSKLLLLQNHQLKTDLQEKYLRRIF